MTCKLDKGGSINYHHKVITGMRKCGKSTLLRVLFRDYLLKQNIPADHIISIALDDRINQKLRNPDVLLAYIRQQVKDNQLYFILMDEIQMVDEFMDVLNSLLHIKEKGRCDQPKSLFCMSKFFSLAPRSL